MSLQGRFEIFAYREADRFRRAGVDLTLLRPLVEVKIARGDLSATVLALVDTGAPFTLFARGVADLVGIDFDDPGARVAQHEIAGGTHQAQVEMAVLTLTPFVDLSWETEIGFFEEEWRMPFAGVLGHQGFLDRWAVSLNYAANYFVIEEPGAFDERLPPDYNAVYQARDLGWRGR